VATFVETDIRRDAPCTSKAAPRRFARCPPPQAHRQTTLRAKTLIWRLL